MSQQTLPHHTRSTIPMISLVVCLALELLCTSAACADCSVPVGSGTKVVASPVVADLDPAFPGLEVAVGTWGWDGAMYVLHADCSIAPGWPVTVGSIQFGSSPAVADVDGDGQLEIFVGSRGYGATGVYAWHHDGTPLAGWQPYSSRYGRWVVGAPNLVDVDGDGDLEVIFAAVDGEISVMHHDDKDGDGKPDPLPGWPVRLSSGWLDSSPAVADVDRDGQLNIIVADWGDRSPGRLFVFRPNGTVLPGWPQYVRQGAIYASPAIADLDPSYPGLEIVIASQYEHETTEDAGRIYAFHADGRAVSGWPVQIDPSALYAPSSYILSSPALSDLNGDGSLEIVVGSQNGKIYAYRANSQRLWSYDTGREIDSSAAIGDVDGDGTLEIVIGALHEFGSEKSTGQGRLYVLNHDGTVDDTWMILDHGGQGIYSSPALSDLDNDGTIEAVFGSLGYDVPGEIFITSLGARTPQSTLPWPMFRHNKTRTGRYAKPGNRPPVLALVGNKMVDEGTALTFALSATDPDSDPLIYAAAPLPVGATFNAATRTFSWKPSYTQAGAYHVAFVAEDTDDARATERIAITVNNVAHLPVMSPVGPQTVAEGKRLTFGVTATDDPDELLTCTTSALPRGASTVTMTALGKCGVTLDWTPDFTQAGRYSISFTARDPDGLTATRTAAITVTNVNRPPVLAPIGNKTIKAGYLLTFKVSASDPDSDPLTYTAAPLPPGAAFDAATRTFRWTPALKQIGTYSVAFAVTDPGTLSDSETITITVTR